MPNFRIHAKDRSSYEHSVTDIVAGQDTLIFPPDI
jgi:hypothetical protein